MKALISAGNQRAAGHTGIPVPCRERERVRERKRERERPTDRE